MSSAARSSTVAPALLALLLLGVWEGLVRLLAARARARATGYGNDG